MSAESAYNLLLGAYMAEVQIRRREFSDTEETRANIRQLAEALTAQNPKQGFLLCGSVGNGKTTLLYALRSAMSFMSQEQRMQHLQQPKGSILVVDALDLATMARKDSDQYAKVCNEPMLAIEDMGKEAAEVQSYGNILNPIEELIEKRYDKQLFTCMTSNLNTGELEQKYGARVYDRFREMLTIITFKNPSYRK